MARIRSDEFVDRGSRSTLNGDQSRTPRQPRNGRRRDLSSSSPSSSDKENRRAQSRTKSPMQSSAMGHRTSSSKRRRLQAKDNSTFNRGQPPPPMTQVEMDEQADLKDYDPDQDPEERRLVRKGLRGLQRDVQDFKSSYMNPENDGIFDTIRQQNELFANVKQTNDACMDSRLLTNVSDMAYKKSQKAARGEGHGQGVDVDDFVSRCISFMRQGDEATAGTTSTQRSRRRRGEANDDDEEEGDIGDALNWEWLGTQACFPVNSRPAVPAFLLGPLSVQKRVRAARVRKERQAKQGPVETTRPEELKAADLEKNEKSNLVNLCKNIYKHMNKVRSTASADAQEEAEHLQDNATPEDVEALLSKHNLCDDEGLELMKFALHPTSFGQTVENLFYISFLVKDNLVGVNLDGKGMISIHDAKRNETDASANGKGKGKDDGQPGTRHQAIFSLDFDTWQGLVQTLDIKEPLIPDRSQEENTTQIGARGWYG